jgi:Glyoxalase-like domain
MNAIDHIVFAVHDLDRGIGDIEQRTGVRPARGGRHPSWGTRNAILSLGVGCYLEIIAPDPERPTGVAPVIFGLASGGLPRLAGWALRVADIRAVHDRALAAGTGIGVVAPGRRERPDGTVLSWQLTEPLAIPADGIIPFLIDWGASPHPSANAPVGCRLVALRAVHPDAAEITRGLSVLGASHLVEVASPGAVDAGAGGSAVTGLVALIDSPNGLITLR